MRVSSVTVWDIVIMREKQWKIHLVKKYLRCATDHCLKRTYKVFNRLVSTCFFICFIYFGVIYETQTRMPSKCLSPCLPPLPLQRSASFCSLLWINRSCHHAVIGVKTRRQHDLSGQSPHNNYHRDRGEQK